MARTRRILGTLLIGAGTCLLAGPAVSRLWAEEPPAGQEQVPNRREFDVTASNHQFTPDRIEVTKDDLVKLTVRSADLAYSVNIDDYRVSKRVPAGGEVTFEFRADQPGTFVFYSNMTGDPPRKGMRGELVVRTR
jgi:heme/copper-type cytochrome/quinol oxidase subunit 2